MFRLAIMLLSLKSWDFLWHAHFLHPLFFIFCFFRILNTTWQNDYRWFGVAIAFSFSHVYGPIMAHGSLKHFHFLFCGVRSRSVSQTPQRNIIISRLKCGSSLSNAATMFYYFSPCWVRRFDSLKLATQYYHFSLVHTVCTAHF